MKKIKLVGYPCKIFKKTALVKDMFTSDLEIARFEGAAVRPVSGICGQNEHPKEKKQELNLSELLVMDCGGRTAEGRSFKLGPSKTRNKQKSALVEQELQEEMLNNGTRRN
ncbi:hypothetical protein CDL15_Pgr010216 [Punica granatum]|uniref:Ribosome biogenesis protein BMS1/TSR1 C-terminal domain-containing protein n=1 Tax=Punica granatum TaxID=22663 RepID=A0A218XQH2_PUNGR|nr:hypothetical protein CDL15_Pgr010216 [Punica granatum]